MLFFHSRSTELLQRVIRAAVASDAPTALPAFLASHGDKAFAQALSGLSAPLMRDALSMLAARDRARLLPRLSRVARKRLQSLERPAGHAALRVVARTAPLCWWFGHRLALPTARPLLGPLRKSASAAMAGATRR